MSNSKNPYQKSVTTVTSDYSDHDDLPHQEENIYEKPTIIKPYNVVEKVIATPSNQELPSSKNPYTKPKKPSYNNPTSTTNPKNLISKSIPTIEHDYNPKLTEDNNLKVKSSYLNDPEIDHNASPSDHIFNSHPHELPKPKKPYSSPQQANLHPEVLHDHDHHDGHHEITNEHLSNSKHHTNSIIKNHNNIPHHNNNDHIVDHPHDPLNHESHNGHDVHHHQEIPHQSPNPPIRIPHRGGPIRSHRNKVKSPHEPHHQDPHHHPDVHHDQPHLDHQLDSHTLDHHHQNPLSGPQIVPEPVIQHHVEPIVDYQAVNAPPEINIDIIAEEKCVDKVEYVEEIIEDEEIKCHHTYEQKCQTTYTTDFEATQEEECDETYQKDCFIEYKKKTQEEIVEQCHTPLVKDCYQPGPVECKTEYESMCETRYISSLWYSRDPIIYLLLR